MPQSIAVQIDVKIASITEKIAYFVDVLLILSTISFKVLSLGRQKRPILPKLQSKYLSLSKYHRSSLHILYFN